MQDMSTAIAIKSQMSAQQLMVLQSEMANRRKSTGLAYVLLLFLGGLGLHRFYLGSTGPGSDDAHFAVVGAATAAIGVGVVLLVGLGVWEIVDLFLVPGLVREADLKAETEVVHASVADVVDDDDAAACVTTSLNNTRASRMSDGKASSCPSTASGSQTTGTFCEL